jgi:hypothetical protein
MTTIVKTKGRRFTSAYVAECKANAEPLEPQSVKEGTLACPSSLKNKTYTEAVERLNVVHVAQHRDHKAQSKPYGTVTGRRSSAQPEFQDIPRKGRGMTRHFLTSDPASFLPPETKKQISDSLVELEERMVAISNPQAVQRGEREPKRVTRTQLDGLNANELHLDEENRLQKGPKKKSVGFGNLRDMLEGN